MKGLMKNIKNYLRDEEGQTSMEYVLILALAAMVIFKLKGQMDTQFTKIIEGVFGKVGDIASQITNN